MHTPRTQNEHGFSLVEVLAVILIMGILTALLLPQFESTTPEKLVAAAQMVASDLDYARSLALAGGSTYRVTFDPARGRYVLEHSGSNPRLETLPDSPFRRPGDPPDQMIVELADLPHLGAEVEIAGVGVGGAASPSVNDVEFDPMGALTRGELTSVWLAAGHGDHRLFLAVEIDPVTGLASVGEIQNQFGGGAN